VDLETGRDIFLEPALARAEYQRRLEAHTAEVRAVCERLGVTLQRLTSDQPLELALFDFLKVRASRGKLARRRTAA
jgi:hypothetical protein